MSDLANGRWIKLVRSSFSLFMASNVASVSTLIYLISINIAGRRNLVFETFNVTLLLTVRLTGQFSLATLHILRLILKEPNDRLVIIAADIGAFGGLLAGIEVIAAFLAWRAPQGSIRRQIGRQLRWSLIALTWAVAGLLLSIAMWQYNVFDLVPAGAYVECLLATAISFLLVGGTLIVLGMLTSGAMAILHKFASK